jgi:hypothetical protein
MVVAAFMATVSANAQFEKGTWSLQPYMGGVISSVTNVDNFDLDDGIELKKRMSVGYIIGGEAEYQFANKFSVAAGVNYTSQGCGWKDIDYWDGPVKVEVKDQSDILGYIKIPIVANYYIIPGLAIKAGIQPSFLMGAQYKMKEDGYSDSRDIKDNCKTFDLAIPLGASYEYKNFVFDARYNLSVLKVNKGGDDKIRNSVIQFTLGYKLPIK